MSNWIDPKVRLPGHYIYCLLSFAGSTAEGYFDSRGYWYITRESYLPLKATVTHWMPLPEAPK